MKRERHWGALQLLLAGLVSISGTACGLQSDRRGVPPDVATVVDTVTEDIEGERYEKIYQEASDLWKQELTLEESIDTFKTLRAKLGKVRNRTLQSATEQHNSGGPLQGEAYILSYRTDFEHGEGMETFTLVKGDGRWLLARYFVNSMALK